MNNLSKSIFSKPDEMEAKISYQAMRITWITINSLFVVGMIWFFLNGGNNPISLTMLLAAEVIYFTAKAYINLRLTRSGKDNE